MRIITIFVLLLVFTQGIFAQKKQEDSLMTVFRSDQPDSVRMEAVLALFSGSQASNDSLAKKYLGMALEFGSRSQFKKGYAQVLYTKGLYEGTHGNFDSSEHYLSKAKAEFSKINYKKGLASCAMAKGHNNYNTAKFKEALAFYIEATKLREEIKDQKGLANSYTWIGNVYNTGLKKPKEAIVYYEKALEIQLPINDEKGLSHSYNNIGNVRYFLKEYKDALKNYERSAELKEKLNDRKGLSNTYNNLGNVNAALKKYDDAINYFKKAMVIYEEFGDQSGVASEYSNIGNVYYDRQKYSQALPYHQKALEISKAIDYREGMRESAYNLAITYEELKDPANALLYFKYSSAINDSIINTDFNQQIVEIETKYETEKKDLEIARNKADLDLKEKQVFIKNVIIASVAGILFLLVVSGTLFYRKKQIEQKAQLAAELANQKEIRTKAIIEAEEKERRRIAQDLHDGVGQILSAAKLNLSSFASLAKLATQQEKDALKNAVDLIDDSVKEVRAVSHNMMPNTLIKLGLASAIREFITKIGNIPNLKIDLEIVGLDKRINDQTETVLYRVIQEIVNNIIKHSKANHISLQLIKHEEEVTVMIEDNGVGFDTSKINEFTGIGLKNIISRIEFLNGSTHFDSTPGHGTNVVIEVPLPK